MDQLSFFDLNDRLEQISKIGDPLEVLDEIVDWNKFDSILLKAKAKILASFLTYNIQDGGDYTPEMGLARAAGALRGENRAERPGTKKAKCLKCDNFTSENDKCSHLQEKDVF